MSPSGLLGHDLQSREPRACGLCGTVRELSRTHIPSPGSRKRHHVRRARQQIKNGVLGPGRYSAGGMWVRGLCDKCNHMSGVKVDRAYAAFAHALRRCLRPSSRRLLLVRRTCRRYRLPQAWSPDRSSSACRRSTRDYAPVSPNSRWTSSLDGSRLGCRLASGSAPPCT